MSWVTLFSMIEVETKMFKKHYDKLEKAMMKILKNETVSKKAHRAAIEPLVLLG